MKPLPVIMLALATSLLQAAEPRPPNFLFILADDLGYGDLGCYGAPDIKTPNIDKLAKSGVRFTDFYANGPLCTPTRCALMTGRYPQCIGAGLETTIPPGEKSFGLPPEEKTIANVLRDFGYATSMAGVWHLGYGAAFGPNVHGFESFFGLHSGNHDHFTHRENNGSKDLWQDTQPVVLEGYSPALVAKRAVEFLSATNDKPFFLYVAFNAPHFPLQGPDDGDRQITLREWATGNRTTYVKMVEALDGYVGWLLGTLYREHLSTNTLVVFTSDNGGDRYSRNAPLAKGKGTLYEGGIRVPCIARWTGRIPGDKVTAQVGITMDWSATILKLAGATPPKHRPFDGIDLMPVLTGKIKPQKRTLFWRRVTPRFVTMQRAVRDGDWKLIDEPNGRQALFNLASDIGETNNLATQSSEQVARLRKLLDWWETDVTPPLYPMNVKAVLPESSGGDSP